jgi:Papain-like cysteine protease AvrRpt2
VPLPVKLPVPHQQQTDSQLCWAACVSMVCAFYGHPVSQTRFSTQFHARWGHGLNAMADPGETAVLIKELTHGAVTMDVVYREDVPPPTLTYRALTWQECKQHLTLRRLVIASRQHHCFVISGFVDGDPRGDILWINDPGNPGAAKALYTTVAEGWVASLVKT